ncbi:GntR family transcriptional regulator [Pseudonocardia spinosispora]|uniref:GntR family transcriptional regulator n=1 Tax=Pseudonocardia spinosispora TaxID=103441 RepID=UPI000568E806|nr:GntR family transcriptional regulator [Pseudonocardia spinosispora]
MEQGDVAYRTLREDITEWRLAPGASLGEVELGRRLGMSRTPVREALKRLAREGLVRTDAGRSAIVAPLSVDEVVQLYQAREAVESYLLRLAAHASDRSAFDELGTRYQRAAQRPRIDADEIYRLSQEFDTAVDAAAANRFLAGMLTELRGQLNRLRRLARQRPERLRESAVQHVAMCRAIRDGDEAEAARAGAARLRDSLATIIDILTGSLLGPLADPPPALVHPTGP